MPDKLNLPRTEDEVDAFVEEVRREGARPEEIKARLRKTLGTVHRMPRNVRQPAIPAGDSEEFWDNVPV